MQFWDVYEPLRTFPHIDVLGGKSRQIADLEGNTDYVIRFTVKSYQTNFFTFPEETELSFRTEPKPPTFSMDSTTDGIEIVWSAAADVSEVLIEITEPHLTYAMPTELIE